uniref:Myelin regulatory factor like n=1 Tax=Astatotilapia calliptera TaxID=8154 RepID=A0A3P8PG48_ASTCA
MSYWEVKILNKDSQDVNGVLDSSVAVDTSILEQYLSNDVDPISFMLPESPPDSGSEAWSPAQIPGTIYRHQTCIFICNICILRDNKFRFFTFLSPIDHEACKKEIAVDLRLSPVALHWSFESVFSCFSTLERKKRRRSESEEPSAGVGTSSSDGEGTHGGVGSTASVGGMGVGSYQLLSWEQYRPEQWSTLHDSNYQTLSPPAYHVDTDKGFNYSTADESFVCQKKNHFQVTVHIGVDAEPQYIKTASGPQEIDFFQIKVFGVKLETPSHLVTIEQSQPDRSKKPFHPVRVSLPGGKITRVTLGRLHFSETTANNMRKKGKPNPDQRYFQMVVGLYAVVKDESFPLTALVSEKIIVRASNPGQFETDGDTMWQRGVVQEDLVCQGRVGINTDSPDEALVVCGNAKVMGTIMQPSDCRAKENIQQVDSEQQLKRINQMKIVEFDYKPEFASKMGIDHTHQTGIIAQEVKELLPSAVKDVGDVICSDGEKINNFLMVDKEQIFMENVGAVQQLSKLTDNLETRINELEVWNRRLAKLKSLTGSLRSTGMSTISIPDACKTEKVQREEKSHKYSRCLRHKVFQISVFALLATMAFCVISITTLYLVNMKEEDFGTIPGNSNTTETPLQTSSWTSTVLPTGSPGLWPPAVDFCDLLYCDKVYCCPSSTEGTTNSNINISKSTEIPVMKGKGEHEWPLHVARLYQSWYHFRSTVAGQADCSTNYQYAGALFTDYHFYFYRHCTEF